MPPGGDFDCQGVAFLVFLKPLIKMVRLLFCKVLNGVIMKKIIVLSLCIMSSLSGMESFSKALVWAGIKAAQQKDYRPAIRRIDCIYPRDLITAANSLIGIALNDSIDGVCLVIACNGGSVHQYSMLYDAMKKIQSKKPVVVFLAGGTYSGGYMMACASDWIVAPLLGCLGSIGVVYSVTRYTENLLADDGEISGKIKVDLFHAGEYKVLDNDYAPALTSDQKKYIQKKLETDYKSFLTLVATNRNLSLEKSEEWAEGKDFSAPQALQLGLIDEIGTIFEAFDKLLVLIKERNPDKNIVLTTKDLYQNRVWVTTLE